MPKDKKVRGYVYILTNKSFRDDWVKIGKSARPVDVRSKELYNTAVPLPFDIYATIQTVKYEDIESNMHDMFDDLAGSRINKKREFFNVTPEKAYNYLRKEAKLCGDAVILGPDYYQKGKVLGPCVPGGGTKPPKLLQGASSSKEYHFRHTNAVPKARLIVKNGEYIVKKGSTVCPIVSDTCGTAKNSRAKWKDYIKDNKTTRDIAFKSPSGAGDFVYGHSTNGKWSWIDDEGNTLLSNIMKGI